MARTSWTAPVGTHDDWPLRWTVTCLAPVKLVRTSSNRPRATTNAAADEPWSCRSVSWPGNQVSSQMSTEWSACSRVHQRSPAAPKRTSEPHRCSALANARTSRSSWCNDSARVVPRSGAGGATVMAAPYTSNKSKLSNQLQYKHTRVGCSALSAEIRVLRHEHVPDGVVEALHRQASRPRRGGHARDHRTVRRQDRCRLQRPLVGGRESRPEEHEVRACSERPDRRIRQRRRHRADGAGGQAVGDHQPGKAELVPQQPVDDGA